MRAALISEKSQHPWTHYKYFFRLELVFQDLQTMRVSEEPVYIDLFRQNPVLTMLPCSLHLRSPVHESCRTTSGQDSRLKFYWVNKYPTDLDHENVLVGWISVNVWLVDDEDIVLVPGELAAGQLQDVSSLTLHTHTHTQCQGFPCVHIKIRIKY
jgi:hypothetical protein